MMLRKSLIGLIALSAMIFGSAANAAIVNGDFETGALDPWFQDREFPIGAFEAWNVTNADAHTGNFSATSTNNIEIRQNFAPVSTDLITEFSFWTKHVGGGSNMFVSFFYEGGSQTNFNLVVPASEWLFFNITSNLLAGEMLSGFSIFGNDLGCPGADCTRTFLDDVVLLTSMSDVPLPAAIWLFIAGSAAIVGVGRKRKNMA